MTRSALLASALLVTLSHAGERLPATVQIPLTSRTEPARTRPALQRIVRASLWLGVLGFGGGLSVLANIRALVVERRRWLTEREFANTVTVSQMLPGGAAANALAYIGLRFHGARGALAAYAGFIFPGWACVMGLAWAYVHFGTTPDVETILGGFNAAVVGIIAAITIKMVRTSVGRLWQMAVAAGALFMTVAGNAPPGEVALLSIVTGIAVDLGTKRARLARQRHPLSLPEEASLPEHRPPAPPRDGGLRVSSLTVVLAIAATGAIAMNWRELARSATVFFRTGLGSYGGGFAIVPHLKLVMERNHWLTTRQFADAVAIGKLTPGPVLLLATFIGYVQQGPIGALVATVAIFAAPFGLVVMAGTWLDRLRSRRPVRSALRGLTPAVLGLMAAAAVTLGGTLNGDAEIGLAAAVTLTLSRFELNPAVVLLVAGLARFALRTMGL
ncbi:MAG TPA: chromate efflux transporter [Myxococcales bacterium]|nr:chromate efflux transporter [Myxococcales bacterium]